MSGQCLTWVFVPSKSFPCIFSSFSFTASLCICVFLSINSHGSTCLFKIPRRWVRPVQWGSWRVTWYGLKKFHLMKGWREKNQKSFFRFIYRYTYTHIYICIFAYICIYLCVYKYYIHNFTLVYTRERNRHIHVGKKFLCFLFLFLFFKYLVDILKIVIQ